MVSPLLTLVPYVQVGEIWVTSPSKAAGYWNQTELSHSEFHASPRGSPPTSEAWDKDGYLRTGDLGFLHSGELFVCGRLKDLIIVRGSNHYPQDIEKSVERCAAGVAYLRAGCSAAFAVKDSTVGEKLVILVEVSPPHMIATYSITSALYVLHNVFI